MTCVGSSVISSKISNTIPSIALVLYTGQSKYLLQNIYDEYTIECKEGDAFGFSADGWLAIALEQAGQRIPFLNR
jgi:hypothetical protein